MGILNGLFGKQGEPPDIDRAGQARRMLAEVRNMTQSHPGKALKTLRKEGKRFFDLVGVGGELHEEFELVVRELWERAVPQYNNVELPVPEKVPWATWKHPTIGDLLDKARATDKGILYCTAPEKRSHRDAMAELEALRFFTEQEHVAMMTIGEEDMMFRTAFLLEACPALDPAAEDIAMDLSDYAKAHGLKAGIVVA